MEFKFPDLPWPKGTKWVKLPSGRMVAEVLVSPALAAKMLELNAGNQRAKKPRTIMRYARDMSNGAWKLTHQGVAFNVEALLHDGQNRLTAVVKSGVSVLMTVWLGAGGNSEMAVTDVNAPRSVRDAANVVEMELDRYAPGTMWAAIRYGLTNGGQLLSDLSHTQKLEILEENADHLNAVGGWFGFSSMARAVGMAPVRAAVFCAQFYLNHKTLHRFVHVLTEQTDMMPGERACRSLRHFLVSQPASSAIAREIFLKVCRSIESFVNKEEPSKLCAAPENPFPLRLSLLQSQQAA